MAWRTTTYRTWISMRQRCNNPRDNGYKFYGRRGIRICKRWDSYENFLSDMGERPAGTSLDRINNDGNYEPSNCRWATPLIQNLNSRNVVSLTLNNETHPVTEWARKLGVKADVLYKRLRSGWPVEKVLGLPVKPSKRLIAYQGETRSVTEWARITGLSAAAISHRLSAGWPIKAALTMPIKRGHRTCST